ncbi:protein N-lysine methyltransferase METTL21A-like [Capsicum galapagoense]
MIILQRPLTCSVIELGSGVGITGVFCCRFCREVVMTDHNDEGLKIKLQESSDDSMCCKLKAEKLEWGKSNPLNCILQGHPEGYDLVLGADICFQQGNVPLLFDTVEGYHADLIWPMFHEQKSGMLWSSMKQFGMVCR